MNMLMPFANGEFALELIPEGDSFKVAASGLARSLAFRDAADRRGHAVPGADGGRGRGVSESALERSLHAKQASLTHWSRVVDRTEATQPLRDGFTRKLEREIDPDGLLSTPELERRVEMARKAHMARMTRLAVKARRERAEAKKAR